MTGNPLASKPRGGHPVGQIAIVLIVLVFSTENTSRTSATALASSTRYNPKAFSPEALSTSIAIRDALQTSHPADLNAGCHLETDFYDPSTGLYSEGVWHNCLMGIASLQQQQQSSVEVDSATALLAESLYKHAWDGTSFRRRTWSGQWDHSILLTDKTPYQANYYQESSEHRCIQHAVALLFWTQLAQKEPQRFAKQQSEIANTFLKEFWNPDQKQWTTSSRSQGGGTKARPSASTGEMKQLQDLKDEELEEPYYRAVDQAMAVLACCEHLRLMDQNRASLDIAHDDDEEIRQIQSTVQATCHQLLSTINNGFGYENVTTAKSYLGLERNRNFWHDGWVLLALIQAQDYYTWPPNNDDEANHGKCHRLQMWQGLIDLYGHDDSVWKTPEPSPSSPSSVAPTTGSSFDGTIWHWPTHLKPPSNNVRYCGDNALAFAICRGMSIQVPVEEGQFWDFVAMLQEQGHRTPLVSVADAYPDPRLHPNTELCALLVWP